MSGKEPKSSPTDGRISEMEARIAALESEIGSFKRSLPMLMRRAVLTGQCPTGSAAHQSDWRAAPKAGR